MDNSKFEYDVALSFAGEDRKYVESVAKCLKEQGVKVFYDKYEKSDLWGKDLYPHLDDVYQNKAKYCVMFISKYYAEKLWTNHERESAQARAFKEKGEYILPARFDNTQIPGIRDTIGYIDLNETTPEQLCQLILTKLKKPIVKENHIEKVNFNIPMPFVKKKFSDYEKKQFLTNGFETIKQYFKTALTLLEKSHDFIKTDFDEITKNKFVTRIYRYDKLENICKIWIGSGMLDNNSIAYWESTSKIDINNDSTLHDYATVEDDGHDIYFNILGTLTGTLVSDINPHRALPTWVAKYFWQRFTMPLER